jgi:glycosyltransferase involved in cell wall biosynthesis
MWRLKTLWSLLKQKQFKTAFLSISNYALKTLNISANRFRLKSTFEPFHIEVNTPRVSPLVSILIPNHNLSFFLESCLNSITKQTYSNFEILIVNSGCDQENLLLAYELKEKFASPNIFWFDGPLLPPGANRNFLATYANGDFLFPIDPDDSMHPRLLQLTLQKALSDSLHIVSPSIRLVGSTKQDWILWKLVTLEMLGFRNHLPACSLINRKVFETIGGYRDFDNQGHRVHEDWEFFYRSTAAGFKLGTVQAVLVDVLVRENSYSAKSELVDLNEQAILIKNMNLGLKGLNKNDLIAHEAEFRLLQIDSAANIGLILDSLRISGTTRKASQAVEIIRSLGYEPIIFVSNPCTEGVEEFFDCEVIALYSFTNTEKYFFVISGILGKSPVLWNIDTEWFYASTNAFKKLNPSLELWDTIYLANHRRTRLSERNQEIELRFLEFEGLRELFQVNSDYKLFPTHLMTELYRVGKSNPKPLKFGVLSRLSPEKNISLSIEISKAYQERYVDELKLIVAGTGTMESFLRDRCVDVPFIEFIGEVRGPEKDQFLESIDLLLITSFVDGISASAIEAIRLGVPVGILPGTPTADFVSENNYGILLSTIPAASADRISDYFASLPYLTKQIRPYEDTTFVETVSYLELVGYLKDRLGKHPI